MESSSEIFIRRFMNSKIVKPKELRGLFLTYHTMDPSQAIERILEAKGLLTDEETELKRQYEIFKRIRMQNGKN